MEEVTSYYLVAKMTPKRSTPDTRGSFDRYELMFSADDNDDAVNIASDALHTNCSGYREGTANLYRFDKSVKSSISDWELTNGSCFWGVSYK